MIVKFLFLVNDSATYQVSTLLSLVNDSATYQVSTLLSLVNDSAICTKFQHYCPWSMIVLYVPSFKSIVLGQ